MPAARLRLLPPLAAPQVRVVSAVPNGRDLGIFWGLFFFSWI